MGFDASRHTAHRFGPSVLVAQEVEANATSCSLAGEIQPTYRDLIGDPAYPKRNGIGVFLYTDTKLEAVDAADPMYGFRRYEARRCSTFQVVGVWMMGTRSRETGYKQAHDGIRRHADWIRQRPTVILGDFNNDGSDKTGAWKQLHDVLEPLRLESAYHRCFKEPLGEESRSTYFHQKKETAGCQRDYCFLPQAWTTHIKNVEVGTYNDWHTISDHAPLIVNLNL